MLLGEAIKDIITTAGIDVLSDSKIVNILSDYQAFETLAIKRIVSTMVNGGYLDLLQPHLLTNDYELQINKVRTCLVRDEGFRDDLVKYVLNSILFAVQKGKGNPNFPNNNECSITHNNSDNACLQISTHDENCTYKKEITAATGCNKKFSHVLFDTRKAAKRLQEFEYIDEWDLVNIGCAQASNVLEQLQEMGFVAKRPTKLVNARWIESRRKVALRYIDKKYLEYDALIRILSKNDLEVLGLKNESSINVYYKYASLIRKRKDRERILLTFYSK